MCIFAIWGHQLIEMALKESTCANATPQNLDLDLLLCGKHKACQRNVWFAESLDQTRDQQHSFCRLQPGPSFPVSCEHSALAVSSQGRDRGGARGAAVLPASIYFLVSEGLAKLDWLTISNAWLYEYNKLKGEI